MALNLSTSPYYDDFDATKNYSRVLFKPGVAVQARELTQLQTILQDQLSLISGYTLKEGAIISGCEEKQTAVPYIKIDDTDAATQTVADSDLPNFIGETVVGSQTGLKATIVDTRPGRENAHPDSKTLYLSYENGGGATNTALSGFVNNPDDPNYDAEVLAHFKAGETLTVTSPGVWKGRTFVVNTFVSSPETMADRYYGYAHRIALSDGLLYVKGQFVRTGKIGCYVDKFNPAVARKIGFLVTESIVQSDDDATLLDPASGTYNENAPGADRYKISVALKSYALDAAIPDNFFGYGLYERGRFSRNKIKNDPLAKIGDQIAKRAYAANGNYIVNGFYTTVREHLDDGNGNGGLFTKSSNPLTVRDLLGDPSKLVAEITPGKCNVGGYLRTLQAKKLIGFDKPTATTSTTKEITTAYGNYVIVDELAGNWNLGSIDAGADGIIDLYDTATNASTGSKSGSTVAGNKIGEAKVRQIIYHSGTIGTASCQYKMYLYDIKMTGTTSSTENFKDVRTFYYNNGSEDAFADPVLNSDGNAEILDPDYNKLLWKLPRSFIKTLNTDGTFSGTPNIKFTYMAEISGLTPAALPSGAFNIVPPVSGDTFPWYNGSADSNLILVATSNFTSASLGSVVVGQIIDGDSVKQTSTSNSIAIDIGNVTSGTPEFKAYALTKTSISSVKGNVKEAVKNELVKINTSTHLNSTLGVYSLGFPDVYKLNSVTAYDGVTLTGTWTYATNSTALTGSGGAATTELGVGVLVVDSNGNEVGTVSSITDDDNVVLTSNATVAGTGATVKGAFITSDGKDVTKDFYLITNQKDSSYGLASIRQNINSSLDLTTWKYLLIEFSRFRRASTTDYNFTTVDSYSKPSNETDSTASDEVYFQEIPLYESSKYGIVDLRDAIDFRPFATATATASSGSLLNASTNPSNVETINFTNVKFPSPSDTFSTDITSYLPQGFRCVVDNEGDISISASPAATKVDVAVPDNDTSMTIATFIAPPFPCLSARAAQVYNRPDLALKVSNLENPHYTMRDIGQLEKRITNIEYYTSLSMLEKEARDQLILDDIGIDRFKNGLLVDSFKGYAVANKGHQDYWAAIDTNRQMLRAKYHEATTDFRAVALNDSDNIQAAQTGPVLHCGAAQVVYMEQLLATKSDPIVLELLYDVEDAGSETRDNTNPNPGSGGSGDGTDISGSGNTGNNTTTIVDDGPLNDPAPKYYVSADTTTVQNGHDFTVRVEIVNHVPGTNFSWQIYDTATNLASQYITPNTLNNLNVVPSDAGNYEATFNYTAVAAGTSLAASSVTFRLSITDSAGNQTQQPSVVINLAKVDSAVQPVQCGPGSRLDPVTNTCVPINQSDDQAIGTLTLNPSFDQWHDSEENEIVQEDKTGEYDQFNYTGAWTATWEGWTDIDPILSQSTRTYEEQTGLRSEREWFVEESSGEHYGDYGVEGYWEQQVATMTKFSETTYNRVDRKYQHGYEVYTGSLPGPIQVKGYKGETTLIPGVRAYARKRAVDFSANGLAKNTLYELSVGEISKGKYTSDSAGSIVGTFQINAKEIEIGTSEVRLVATGNTSKWTAANSFAVAYYTSVFDGTQVTDVYLPYDISPPKPPKRKVTGPIVSTDPYQYDKQKTDVGSYEVYIGEPVIVYKGNSLYNVNGYGYVATTSTTNWNTNDLIEVTQISPNTGTAITVTAPNTGNTAVSTIDTNNDNPYSTAYKPTVNTSSGVAVADTNTNYTTGSQTTPTVNPIFSTTEFDFTSLNSDAMAAEQAQMAAQAMKLATGWNGGMCNGWDPMAQTFYVEKHPGGIVVHSVDLFFSSISSEANNNGITLEIRDVVNGYPGNNVIGSVSKKRRDCKIASSTNGVPDVHLGTTFTFESPVYLENNTEYCLVPLPDKNDPDYKVYIAEMGQPELGGDGKVVSSQPSTGVHFTSANNRTWTAHQNQDMMFRIKRNSYRTNTEYTATLKNKNTDWLEFTESTVYDPGTFIWNITTTPSNFTADASIANLTGAAVTFTDESQILNMTMTANTDALGQVTALTVTSLGTEDINKTPVIETIGGVDVTSLYTTSPIRLNRARVTRYSESYNTHEVEVIQGFFTTGSTITNGSSSVTVATIHDRIIDAYTIKARMTNFGKFGTIIPRIYLQSTDPTSTRTTTFNNSTMTEFYMNKTNELSNPAKIYSYSNLFDGSRGGTCTIQFVMKTAAENMSPMINADTLSMFLTTNVIDSVSTGEVTTVGGNPNGSRYITKKVILASGQESEDFKVWLDNKIPSVYDSATQAYTDGAVEVYVKLQAKEDQDVSFLEDISWRKLDIETQPNNPTGGWGEFVYKLPTKTAGFGLNGSGQLEYDVNSIASVGITSGGTGYEIGDVLQISGNGSGGHVRVTAVNTGAITAVEILNGGRYHDTPTATCRGTGGNNDAVFSLTLNTTTYTGFKAFAVKIVQMSSNSSQIPKSANLRAYALLAA